MENLTEILWQKTQDETLLFISKEQFLQSLEGWDIVPVHMDGELAFVTLQKGPLFHFQSMGTGKQLSMKMIREFLAKIIKEYGYAETHTPKDDVRQNKFNQIFGFELFGDDEFDNHYRIKKLRHSHFN